MPSFDIDTLLEPSSEEAPCGEAVDYDVDFLLLQMAARGRSEQQIGDSVSAAEAPDWIEVNRLALELCTRSKDLRVAILLARAELQNRGFAGLASALRLLLGYVERYWDAVHPVPEPDDEDGNAIRINVLADLCNPDGLLQEMRLAPLVRSPHFGAVSLRDIQIANGTLEPGPASSAVDVSDVEGAFRDADPSALAADSEALADSIANLEGVSAALDAHDNENGGQLDALLQSLRQAKQQLDERIGNVRGADAVAKESPPAETEDADIASPSAGGGNIRDRGDVVATLDRICRWYLRNEPASPVPMLLDRAKRLVAKDFLTLIVELAPDGAEQFRHLAGMKSAADEPGT
jgi:type VI secretion system protein ImpA